MNKQIEAGQNIAVVGGGVAGIVAAYLLREKHQVTLFEQNDYLGGHTNTIEIPDGPDAGLAVDTGFIVLNDATYPLFRKFLDRLGVATRNTEMSFGFQCLETGLVYAGTNLNGLFALRRNLVNLAFLRFLMEVGRFNNRARVDLQQSRVPAVTLGEYLQRGRFSKTMIENYLLPMAAAIWSTPALRVTDFPAHAFLRFFSNHGLLSIQDRPQWQTVVGGSHAYVKAFQREFRGDIRLRAGVRRILRQENGIRLQLAGGEIRSFDQVVVAGHADQALRLLGDPSGEEQRLLSAWTYQSNRTVLHTDASLLPVRKAARAAWNFTREAAGEDGRPVFVTYYMNRLQGLQATRDYCVTLNRRDDFRPETVIAEFDYHHPRYDFAALEVQPHLPQLNGQRRTWFCGSYFGYGFHEDAVRSAVAVGAGFGAGL